jgi:hypothetical protein
MTVKNNNYVVIKGEVFKGTFMREGEKQTEPRFIAVPFVFFWAAS